MQPEDWSVSPPLLRLSLLQSGAEENDSLCAKIYDSFRHSHADGVLILRWTAASPLPCPALMVSDPNLHSI